MARTTDSDSFFLVSSCQLFRMEWAVLNGTNYSTFVERYDLWKEWERRSNFSDLNYRMYVNRSDKFDSNHLRVKQLSSNKRFYLIFCIPTIHSLGITNCFNSLKRLTLVKQLKLILSCTDSCAVLSGKPVFAAFSWNVLYSLCRHCKTSTGNIILSDIPNQSIASNTYWNSFLSNPVLSSWNRK